MTTGKCGYCGVLAGKDLCTVIEGLCPYKARHGFADHRSIATCECGASFEGDHEAEAMALWAAHCEAEE